MKIVEVTDVAEYEGACRVARSARAQGIYVLHRVRSSTRIGSVWWSLPLSCSVDNEIDHVVCSPWLVSRGSLVASRFRLSSLGVAAPFVRLA